ncbi:MAG: PAS domain S-box protein [Deltaproteobacteria bacterium]|nr:PAS domain S-box protein [Deltaproteobacteria bacterium]
MNILSWLISSWPRMSVDDPVDLASWRLWYCKIAVVIGVIFLPVGLAISLPVFIADGNYLNIIIDLIAWFLLISRLFSDSNTYKGTAYILFAAIYGLTVFLFINLGPTHARPAYLVLCAVMAALMFGIRGAIISTIINTIILITLYWLIRPENMTWTAENPATYGEWVMFVVNVTLVTLGSSLPIGFMLNMLDRSLKHEREIRERLSEESEKLRSLNITLEEEIEQRRQVDENLKMSEEKFRLLVENIPSVTWITSEHGRTAYISPNVESIYGLSPEEIYNHGDEVWFGRIHPDDRGRIKSSFQKMFALDREFDLEYRIQRMDGKWIWLHDKGVKAFEKDGIRYAYGVFTDITEKKQAEENLRENEEYLKLIFDYAPDGYYLTDQEGRFLNWNKACEQITGYGKEEMVGKRLLETSLISSEQMQKAKLTFDRYRQGLHFGPGEVSLSRKDGGKVFVEINTYPIKMKDKIQLLGIARDITERKHVEQERKKLEHHLQQSQKMEAIGTLAGGIAHDFNNILTALIGFTELALKDAVKGTIMERNLRGVLKAGDRAKELVKQILTFSRYTEHELKPIQIKVVAKEVLKLIRASLPSTIEMRQNIISDSIIMADPVHIHQVIMNFCTNAGHAMMDKGGILEVSLTDVELDSESTEKYQGMNPGTYVKLIVKDTGHGMSAEILDRIFDPYFTTKAPGEGTGLGLSVVHGIVKSYNGIINVQSEPGKGSTFEVYLPVVAADAISDEESDEPLPAGKEHILFVDDEPVLSEVGVQIFERLGYQVTPRISSVEALELFRSQPERFDLVITDMTMPIMTGEALAAEIMKVRPDIPVILCTGFSHHINKQKAAQLGIRAFIMKPFVIRDIAAAIREVLGS